jgi:hypothetical protein
VARKPYISLARDKSRRPIRGQPAGDIITGSCEVEGCGVVLHRGDDFRTFVGDRLMCVFCYLAGAVLKPLIVVAAPKIRAKRTGRLGKRQLLIALRRARTEQLIREVNERISDHYAHP